MMNNKYRQIDPQIVVPPSREPEIVQGSFEGGIVLTRSPQQIEMNQSPRHDKVRVKIGALQADFGVTQVGDTTAIATSKVYALGEHRYFLEDTTFEELIFRLYHTGSSATTITYNGGAALTSLEITAANTIISVGTTSFVGVIDVGAIIYLTDMSTAANNNVNCKVLTVAANTLTLVGTPLTIQGADSACSLIQLPSVALIDSIDIPYDLATAEWVAEITNGGTAVIEVPDALVSWRSYFDVVFFADGTQVYKWDKASLLNNEGNDFPTTNSLTEALDSTDVTVTPAGADLDRYHVNYDITLTGPSEEGATVVVSAYHAGLQVGTKTWELEQSSDTARVFTNAWAKFDFTRIIANNDVVTLKIDSITQAPVTRTNVLDNPGAPPDTTIYGDKSPLTRNSYDGEYIFDFYIDDFESTGGEATIGFYFDVGAGQVQATTQTFAHGRHQYSVAAPTGSVAAFQLVIESVDPPGTVWRFYSYDTDPAGRVLWDEGFDTDVHGFNLATDLDDVEGITYSIAGGNNNDLVLVNVSSDPASATLIGRYLGVIAEHIVILQASRSDDGLAETDQQRLMYCKSGEPTVWEGTGTDDLLLRSASDPVDALMALEVLSANVGALFRQRSIMRVVVTGTASVPLAFYPWIEKLGTESPFSVVTTPYGIMFLGNDRQIYLLTEGGHKAVGQPINEKFNIDEDDLASVEAVYDPIEQEYILSIPVAH
ncbi:MAG: hypothetical protein KKD77_20560 [Gammaproteobacteria bacterium]|nr:hypothetical protein [Gammaproteobacteria bacterium]